MRSSRRRSGDARPAFHRALGGQRARAISERLVLDPVQWRSAVRVCSVSRKSCSPASRRPSRSGSSTWHCRLSRPPAASIRRRTPAGPRRASFGKMRVEIGPAEIQAAINAQNFDRAAQLIDWRCARGPLEEAKAEPAARGPAAASGGFGCVAPHTLVDARMQQDELIDPPRGQCRLLLDAGAQGGRDRLCCSAQIRELSRRLPVAAHTRRRSAAVSRTPIGSRARCARRGCRSRRWPRCKDAALARTQRAADAPRCSRLRRSRVSWTWRRAAARRGKRNSIPRTTARMHYLNELDAADPQNGSLAQLSKAGSGADLSTGAHGA